MHSSLQYGWRTEVLRLYGSFFASKPGPDGAHDARYYKRPTFGLPPRDCPGVLAHDNRAWCTSTNNTPVWTAKLHAGSPGVQGDRGKFLEGRLPQLLFLLQKKACRTCVDWPRSATVQGTTWRSQLLLLRSSTCSSAVVKVPGCC
jgi:hypothetical protein